MAESPCKTVSNEDCLINKEVIDLLASLIETIDKKEQSEEENLENFTLLWCDSQVNSSPDNRQTQLDLRQSINFLKTFESADSCQLYIESKSNEYIVLIVSGSIGRELIPGIHSLPQVIAIYVFCLDIREHETWSAKYEKVKKVTSGKVQLLDAIINDQAQRNNLARQENIDITVFSVANMRSRPTETVASSREYSHQSLDSDFMWSQLIVEVLLKMNEPLREHYFNIFIANCKKQYHGNLNDLKIVDELEEYYYAPAAIFWYTRDSFLYRVLNRALRCRDDHVLVTMAFFIHDIYIGLQEKQKELAKESSIIRVYRGQLMSIVELEKMKTSVGKYISINSFFSTTKQRQLAWEIYAGAKNNRSNQSEEAILFEIDADANLMDAKPFADITNHSAFDKTEQEVLFMLGSIFKIVAISQTEEENLWIIKLELSTEKENELKSVADYMKKEIPEETDLMSLGIIYYNMGKYFEAEQYFEKTANILSEADANLAGCYSNLGMIAYCGYGDYQKAFVNYSKALELELRKPLQHKHTLGNIFNNLGNVLRQQGRYTEALEQYSNVFKIDLDNKGLQGVLLAAVYLNIGIVYKELGKHVLALESMNESLTITSRELPENHPTLASIYNYIALVQQSTRDFESSMRNFQRALSIQLAASPDHPETAITYNNIGMTYVLGSKNYTEALINYEKSLKIFENASLTSNRPAMVSLLTNIGFLYRQRESYDLALEYYERALQMQLEWAPSHSTTAVIYDNLGLIYQDGFQNYSEALSNYKKAIEIFQTTLPADHPDLGKALSHIADVYNETDEYELALTTYQEALKILSSSILYQTDIAALYAKLALVYTNGFQNYIDALSNLEKALYIYTNLSLSDQISVVLHCIQVVKERQENDNPLEYNLTPKHRYSMKQILGDGEVLTNMNDSRVCVPMSEFIRSNTTVALYFANHASSFSCWVTSELAEIYKQMLSSETDPSLSFDIIYVWLCDSDEESFIKSYREMPWKTLPYRRKDTMILLQRMLTYFNLERMPRLIVFKATTGEILSEDGHRALIQMKLNAIKQWCCGEKAIRSRSPCEEFIWYSVQCDGDCGMLALKGLRYHCKTCENYDLCARCKEAKGHEHALELMEPSYESDEEQQ
ncbi:unnamed protein product [Adineta ricciae]|uniref:ZZ-type domain-containing protein n=1 Tax=Adineta ricciae TaxID=249248 RepID=A0A816E0M6_ADIRI|nr:unnamed protein product [Adineta ricciae]